MMISSDELSSLFFAILIWPFIAGFIVTFVITKKASKSFGSLFLSIFGNCILLVIVVKNYAFFEQYGDDFDDKAFMFFTFIFPIIVTIIMCIKRGDSK